MIVSASLNRQRDDGFVEITGAGTREGEVLRVLVYRDYLDRR
jgi:hypothetical protein